MLEGFRNTKLKSHPKQHRVYWKAIWKSETATPLLRNIWRRSGENSIKYSSPSIRRPWSAPHRGKFFSDSGENKSPISTLPFNPGLISSDVSLLTFQIVIFVIFCKCASSCSPFRACPYPAQIRRCIKNWIFKEKSVDAARWSCHFCLFASKLDFQTKLSAFSFLCGAQISFLNLLHSQWKDGKNVDWFGQNRREHPIDII